MCYKIHEKGICRTGAVAAGLLQAEAGGRGRLRRCCADELRAGDLQSFILQGHLWACT